jgi:hypothetical protein
LNPFGILEQWRHGGFTGIKRVVDVRDEVVSMPGRRLDRGVCNWSRQEF